MSEEKKVPRRDWLKWSGGAIAGLVVGGAVGYLAKPAVEAPGVTTTVTAPGATVTVTQTLGPTATLPPTLPPATINMWGAMYNQPPWLQTGFPLARKLFMEKYPGCDVNNQGVPYSKWPEQQVIVLQGSNPPDMPQLIAPFIACIPNLEPLDDYMQRYNWPIEKMHGQTIYPSKWPKNMGGDDKIYGAVQNWTPESAALYRKDILKERGFDDPEEQSKSTYWPKWSLDEFLDIIRKCTFKRADGTQVFGYAFPTSASDGVSRWREDWQDYLMAAGGGLVRPERPGEIICGKDPYLKANVEVGEFMRTLVKEKLVPVGVEKPKYFDMQITGTVCFTRHAPIQFALWNVPEQNPWGGGHQDQLVNIGTTLLPFFGKGWNYVDESDALFNGIAKNSKYKEQAFAFCDVLVNTPEMATWMAETNYAFPGNPDLISPEFVSRNPFWRTFIEGPKISKLSFLLGDVWGLELYGADIWKAWFDMAQKIVYSDASIEDLYVQLQGTLEKLVSA